MDEDKLGKDANGNPLKENHCYVHIKTGMFIYLKRDDGGFRIEYGRNRPDIFRLSEGQDYRPATPEELKKQISEEDKEIQRLKTRKSWLEKGLAALTGSAESITQQPSSRRNAMDAEDDYIGPEVYSDMP